MSDVLQQRTVLVTGAGRGIGAHLTERFAQDGYRVFGLIRRQPDAPLSGVEYIEADVSDEMAVMHAVRQVAARSGRLDVVVNNAGVASMNHSLLTPASSVDKILDTNVKGTFLVSREAAKVMMKQRVGRIINIGSFGVPLRVEGEAIYVASKAAVVTLSQVMAKELAPYGITVNVVGPTAIETDIIKHVPRAKLMKLNDSIALKRFGTPEEVYHVVKFFSMPESAAITGQVIYLGGA